MMRMRSYKLHFLNKVKDELALKDQVKATLPRYSFARKTVFAKVLPAIESHGFLRIRLGKHS